MFSTKNSIETWVLGFLELWVILFWKNTDKNKVLTFLQDSVYLQIADSSVAGSSYNKISKVLSLCFHTARYARASH